MNISANVTQDDHGNDIATVTIAYGADEYTIVVHESLLYSNAINVEVDGDFDSRGTELRVNVNDNLVLGDPGRTPDISPSDEDRDWWEVDYTIDGVPGSQQVVADDEESALYHAKLALNVDRAVFGAARKV